MAVTSYKLKMLFDGEEGTTKTITLTRVDSQLQAGDVNDFMNLIITNGSIFTNSPVRKKGASLVKQDVTEFAMTE